MSIYNQKNENEIADIFKYGKTIAEENNIYFHSPAKQNVLAEVLLEADVMVYPNHFPETSCITVMESIKAKTPVITSAYGALPETIKSKEGVLIPGKSYDEGYEDKFITETVKMLTDDSYRNTFCQEDRDMSWNGVAKDWNTFLSNPTRIISKFAKYDIKETKEGKRNINTPDYWNQMHDMYVEIGMERKGNKERWEFLSKLIPENSYIVDVGCSDGDFLSYLYKNQIGSSLTGIEISEKAIALAKANVPLADFCLIPMTPIELPCNDIDIIFSNHVMEHLEEPEKYIECWKKSLKPDGEMVLILPLDDEPYEQHLMAI